MAKTFLIACGGTGGHLSPGIAVAQELLDRGHRCILLVSQKAIDQTFCQAYPHLSTLVLPGIGFTRRVFTWPRCGWQALKNIFQSFRWMQTYSADAVIGFGGFTNVGVIVSAFLLRKPCFLHEANQVMGRTIRWLGRWATMVYVPPSFCQTSRLSTKPCPFPLRKDFKKIDAVEAKKQLGCDPQKPLLVIVGGSQGSQVLSQWACEQMSRCAEKGIQMICVTGMRSSIKSPTGVSSIFCRFLPFSHSMSILYSAADLVIGRAGAGTIAELARCETPSILVPLSTAADHHQMANARVWEQAGGCYVLEQSKLSELWGMVQKLLSQPSQLQEMALHLYAVSSDDGAKMLADDLERTVGCSIDS